MYPGPRAAGTHDPSSWHRTVQVCPHRSGGLKAELRVLTGGLLEALLEKPVLPFLFCCMIVGGGEDTFMASP